MTDAWTYAALALVGLAALWLVMRRADDDEEGMAEYAPRGKLDPKVENHINRMVAQYIRKNWAAIKQQQGFDQPLDKYFEWFGRGRSTYGCNKRDGTATNYRLCKRWSKLNNKLFITQAKMLLASQSNKRRRASGNVDVDYQVGLTDEQRRVLDWERRQQSQY